MKAVIFKVLSFVLLLLILVWQFPRLTEEKENVMVNRTFVKDNMYLVYTDVDTYEFDDSMAYFKFFPDEDWGKIKEKACYEFTTVGYRIKLPFKINIYENVVGFKEITCTK